MAVLLTDLTPAQLDQLISQAAARKKQLHKRKPIGAVRTKIEAAAATAGYTIEELFGASSGKSQRATVSKTSGKAPRAGGKVAPKYRNPDNAEQTWSGRGLRPVWLRDAMSARGAKLEDFAI